MTLSGSFPVDSWLEMVRAVLRSNAPDNLRWMCWAIYQDTLHARPATASQTPAVRR